MIMLKAVVLPEPFGPISAVMVPSLTSNEQPFTAATPPKCFVKPSTPSKALTAPSLRAAWPARAWPRQYQAARRCARLAGPPVCR